MSTIEHAEEVRKAKAAIRAAQQKCWEAKTHAEKVMYAEQRPHEQVLCSILGRLQGEAKELAIHTESCPRERWGGHMEPSDITVQEDGLHLSWDINECFAPAHFLATWEMLQEQLK